MRASSLSSVLLGLLLAGCGPEADIGAPEGPPPTPRSLPLAPIQLQIMTWNVLFMEMNIYVPSPGGIPIEFEWRKAPTSFAGLDYEERAVKVAEGIKAAAPDVVVLNEVYSDEARDILVEQLEADYPHFVSYLHGDPPAEEEYLTGLDLLQELLPPPASVYAAEPLDSGLMLFSKVPFAPLAETHDDASMGFHAQSDGSDVDFDYVAFHAYDACAGFDCLSSKGVGLVALDTAGTPTYVAFTHMQAEDEPGIRVDQYDEIADFLLEVIPEGEFSGSAIYLAGDLNTPGGSAEWADIFDPGGSIFDFYDCGNEPVCDAPYASTFVDAWGFETSPDDPGLTSQGKRRLDYILHNRLHDGLCLQHIRKPYEVRGDGSGGWWSDHRPIVADINLSGRWCSANPEDPIAAQRPHELQFGPLDCTNNCNADIEIQPGDGAVLDHAGSMQWFVVEEPGSYSFQTISHHPYPDVEIGMDVYEADDLSRPLLPHDDEPHPEHGFMFAMYEPPYFIRTYAVRNGEPARDLGNVEYTFDAHQHLCRSPDDACAIDPLDDAKYPWPAPSATTNVEAIWYRFRTASVTNGKLSDPAAEGARHQDVRFLLETSNGHESCVQAPYLVDYVDPSNPTNIQTLPPWADMEEDSDLDFDDDGLLDRRYTSPPLPGNKADWRQYYLAIPRSCDEAMETTTRLDTALTYVRPGYTECDKQYDDSGVGEDDHIGFDFTFDQGSGEGPSCEQSCSHYVTFDEDWPEGSQTPGSADLGRFAGYYMENFVPNMFEEEGDAEEADERLTLNRIESGGVDLHIGEGFGPLDPSIRELSGLAIFADRHDNDDADYWYTMEFELNHRGPKYRSP